MAGTSQATTGSELVTCPLTMVTGYVTDNKSRSSGTLSRGIPESGARCGARARICTPLPGGSGASSSGTTTGLRGARWTADRPKMGKTPIRAAFPGNKSLELSHRGHSRWRVPQVERRKASGLRYRAAAAPGHFQTATSGGAARHIGWMRLSALRFPLFAEAKSKRVRGTGLVVRKPRTQMRRENVTLFRHREVLGRRPSLEGRRPGRLGRILRGAPSARTFRMTGNVRGGGCSSPRAPDEGGADREVPHRADRALRPNRRSTRRCRNRRSKWRCRHWRWRRWRRSPRSGRGR